MDTTVWSQGLHDEQPQTQIQYLTFDALGLWNCDLQSDVSTMLVMHVTMRSSGESAWQQGLERVQESVYDFLRHSGGWFSFKTLMLVALGVVGVAFPPISHQQQWYAPQPRQAINVDCTVSCCCSCRCTLAAAARPQAG
eukprot:6474124-Amphidinium_carterae.1